MKIFFILLTSVMTLFAMEPLVTASWLQKAIAEKSVVVVDVSDARLYLEGHIPGSRNAPINLWRMKTDNHLVVCNAEAIEKLMRSLGIEHNSSVVVYSHHDNAKDILKATYVLWAMEYYGLKESALLDGGIVAWKAQGGTLEKESPKVVKGDFKAVANPSLIASLRSSISVHKSRRCSKEQDTFPVRKATSGNIASKGTDSKIVRDCTPCLSTDSVSIPKKRSSPTVRAGWRHR